MDTVFLRGLQVQVLIGLWEWERRKRQTVTVDLEMDLDTRDAARHDRVEHTVDYGAVAERIHALGESTEFQLVEAFAEAIARLVTVEFGVPQTLVSVAKPRAVRGSREVGVRISRTRADFDVG